MTEVLWFYELYDENEADVFSYRGEAFPFSTFWSRLGANDVPPGYIFGFMGGTVRLSNGWYCGIDYPYAETTVY